MFLTSCSIVGFLWYLSMSFHMFMHSTMFMKIYMNIFLECYSYLFNMVCFSCGEWLLNWISWTLCDVSFDRSLDLHLHLLCYFSFNYFSSFILECNKSIYHLVRSFLHYIRITEMNNLYAKIYIYIFWQIERLAIMIKKVSTAAT